MSILRLLDPLASVHPISLHVSLVLMPGGEAWLSDGRREAGPYPSAGAALEDEDAKRRLRFGEAFPPEWRAAG